MAQAIDKDQVIAMLRAHERELKEPGIIRFEYSVLSREAMPQKHLTSMCSLNLTMRSQFP